GPRGGRGAQIEDLLDDPSHHLGSFEHRQMPATFEPLLPVGAERPIELPPRFRGKDAVLEAPNRARVRETLAANPGVEARVAFEVVENAQERGQMALRGPAGAEVLVRLKLARAAFPSELEAKRLLRDESRQAQAR